MLNGSPCYCLVLSGSSVDGVIGFRRRFVKEIWVLCPASETCPRFRFSPGYSFPSGVGAPSRNGARSASTITPPFRTTRTHVP